MMVSVGATDAALGWPPRNLLHSRTTSHMLWPVGSWDDVVYRGFGPPTHKSANLEWCSVMQGDRPVPVCWASGLGSASNAHVAPLE